MTRRRVVIGNWKMNTTLEEATGLASQLEREITPGEEVVVGIAPPFPWLQVAQEVRRGGQILVGAQTCAATNNGAYTGEVSAAMLAEFCDFVLIGHSERRSLFGETDSAVREKLLRALEHGLQPVLCVGETLEQRQTGSAEGVVAQQLIAALGGLEPHVLSNLVIAFEPVWAIGTGKTATPADASAMGQMITGVLNRLGLEDVPVLYGGSVSAQNAASLVAEPNVDGFLVGGASLKLNDFLAIIAAAGN